MPTYEYECLKCGENFEVFQSMKDKPLKKHESCGGKVKRLISGGAGIIFKGSGFYQTDYKMKSSRPSDKNSSEKKEIPSKTDSKTKSGSSSEKKSESKKKE